MTQIMYLVMHHTYFFPEINIQNWDVHPAKDLHF